MTALLDRGFTFIDAGRLLDHLDTGAPLGPRDVLLTFDDGYQSLLEYAAPILAGLGLPAVVCVVTSQLGGHNKWDVGSGATKLPLLDAGQLRYLSRAGWEIASHTHSHAHLTSLRAPALREELGRPRSALAGLGLPAPRLLAYPHGEQDLRVRGYARRAGYRAAFALRSAAQPESPTGRYALPRVEVRNGMDADRLCHLLTRPAPAPPELGREFKAMIRLAMDGVPRQRRAAADQGVNR
jgi:peptidoglycan/xylan/chitin deacetylase (PgdA/CDA1 family)